MNRPLAGGLAAAVLLVLADGYTSGGDDVFGLLTLAAIVIALGLELRDSDDRTARRRVAQHAGVAGVGWLVVTTIPALIGSADLGWSWAMPPLVLLGFAGTAGPFLWFLDFAGRQVHGGEAAVVDPHAPHAAVRALPIGLATVAVVCAAVALSGANGCGADAGWAGAFWIAALILVVAACVTALFALAYRRWFAAILGLTSLPVVGFLGIASLCF